MIEAFDVTVSEKHSNRTIEEYIEALGPRGKRDLLEFVGDTMVMAIQRYAPRAGVGAQGGKLATTAYYEIPDENRMELFLQDYWIYPEFGTRPHTIRPKSPKGVLAFPKKEAAKGGAVDFTKDQMVFTKKVEHPGTEAQFYLAKSWNESRALVERKLDMYAEGRL